MDESHTAPQMERKISLRFRNINIALFVLASVLMTTALFMTLQNMAMQVSKDYAKLYAANTANAFSAYLNREIGLIAKAAHSQALIDWFTDEDNQEKKARAHEEMMELFHSLSSDNLYIGIEKSLNEYSIGTASTIEDTLPHSVLTPKNSADAWYFNCIASGKEYLLNVDVDKALHRKRVWLNYKVSRNGIPLGVLSTGMLFSQVVEDLFSKYDGTMVRGLIIDENGLINMDSALLGTDDFLYFERSPSEWTLPSAIKAHLTIPETYFPLNPTPTLVALPSGPYRYAAIAPIGATNWSVVTLYKASPLLSQAKFLPVIAVMLALFAIFALTNTFLNYGLIFRPLKKLIDSLALLKNDTRKAVYGIERRDELGVLANTIHGLFTDAHHDALTGAYNRRFMDKHLQHLIEFLSRSDGTLSVLIIDVDHFKNYNDTYGHDMGDSCLKAIAQELMKTVHRGEDFVIRHGGEEFAAILPNTDKDGARVIADRLLNSIRALELPHKSSATAPHVTISIGGTTSRVTHTLSPNHYLRRADEALYMSKQNGRNQYTHLDLET